MALSDAVSSAVAHWKLNESSGTRVDSVGSNDLTDNNTVGVGTGKFGNAADFEATNSESLSLVDTEDVSVSDIDFSVRCWVQLESKGTNRAILSHWDSVSSDRSYLLAYIASSDRFVWFVSANGTTNTNVAANSLGSPAISTWYLIHAWHDASNNQIGISVNAGTPNTAAHSTGVRNSSGDFVIGNLDGGGDYFDGLIDDVVILKNYILDSTERTADYNSGTGVAFEDWGGGGATVSLTTATESDTANAITVVNPRTYTLGTATETDAANAVTVQQAATVSLGTASETDTASALTVVNPRTYQLGTATETSTANAVTVANPRSYTLSTASETDSANAVTVTNDQSVSLGTASETAVANSLTVVNPRSYTLTTATEVNVGRAVTVINPRAYNLATATETDSANALSVISGDTTAGFIKIRNAVLKTGRATATLKTGRATATLTS